MRRRPVRYEAICAADQSVLSQGPPRQLRQARADAVAGADQHRGDDAGDWEVDYWDENLLQGRRLCEPLPEVVGITVHLTFARRAFELARWYRERGAKVVLGGLHVLSCPEEARRTPTRWPWARACSSGRGSWRDVEAGCLRARLRRRATRATTARIPPPRRRSAAARELPDHHQPDRHARLPQPLRVLLPRDRRPAMPYQVRDPDQVVAEFAADGQPYARLHRQQSRLAARVSARALPGAAAAEKIWSAAVSIDVTDDPSLVRDMALAGCTGVFVGFESLADENLAEARKKTPRPPIMPAGWRSCTTTASRSTAASCWASTTTAKTSSRGRPTGSRRTAWSAPRFTS